MKQAFRLVAKVRLHHRLGRRLLVSGLIMPSVLLSCKQRTPEPPVPITVPVEHSRAVALAENVRAIPPGEALQAKLEAFLTEVERTRMRDMAEVRKAVKRLSDNPAIEAALVSYYEAQPKTSFARRRLAIAVLGELGDRAALAFFTRVTWEQLPPRARMHDFSPRDEEEMVRVSAVHGIGYLRSDRCYDALIHIMRGHESKSVRIAAIESYMWNRGDNKADAVRLYKLLPADLHPYVNRPRFHRDIDVYEFNRSLQAWHDEWRGSDAVRPPVHGCSK